MRLGPRFGRRIMCTPDLRTLPMHATQRVSHKGDQLSLACPYCANVLPDRAFRPVCDTVLEETPNFLVTPTLGSLVPGWVLVIPKSHIFNFGQLPLNLLAELFELCARVRCKLESAFGPVTEFEHGPTAQGDLLGCGINHAHLHMVSLPFDLTTAVSTFSETSYDWSTCHESWLLHPIVRNGSPYLYYRTPNDLGNITAPKTAVSQYFRKVVATNVGLSAYFDYHNHSFDEKAAITVSQYLNKNDVSAARAV